MDNLDRPLYNRLKAVAIQYNPEEIAPKILAKGAGVVASKILENASDIPVHKDAALVEDLTRLDIGEHIPPELYEVVAQILVFISDLDRQAIAAERAAGTRPNFTN